MTLPSRLSGLLPSRRMEALAHVSSWLAVALTIIMVRHGPLTESNPVTAALIDHVGMYAFAALTPLLISALYRLLDRYADHHFYFALPSGMLTADAIGNAAVVMTTGLPETLPWGPSVPGVVAIGALSLACYVRVESSLMSRWVGIPKLTRSKGRIAAIVLSLLLVTSGLPASIGLNGPVGDARAGHGGYAYTGSNDNTMKKINTSDQTTAWTYTGLSATVQDIAVAHDGETVYATGDGVTVAVFASNGTEKWRYTNNSANTRTVQVDGSGNVYSGGLGTAVHSIAASDGTSQWVYNESADGIQSIEVDGSGNVYAGTYGNEIHSVAASDGTQQWIYTGHTNVVNDIAADGNGTIYSASDDVEVHSINTSDGSQNWAYTGHSNEVDSIEVGPNGKVYSGSIANELHAISDSDGTHQWTYSGHTDVVSAVSVDSHGNVYSGSWDNEVHSIAASDGTNQWTYTGHSGSVLETDTTYDLAVGATSTASEGSAVTGRAENQNGQPVANATIRLTTVNTSAIDSSDPVQEAKDRVRNASDVTPDYWNPNTQLSGSDGKFGEFNGEYPIVFRSEVSGNMLEPDSDDVANPQLTVPAGQSIKVTGFDASQRGNIFGFGELSRQQPGAPVEGGTVVFEQVDASNATVNKHSVELDKDTKEIPGDPEYMHYNSTTLNAGYYRVYMEDNPSAWVPLQVGQPTEMIKQSLNDIDNNPTPRSSWVSDQIENGPMATQTVTTNSTGHFSASVPENAKVVGVQGIKASSLDVPEENLTEATIRNNATDLNGSVYLPSRVYEVEPPASDVTVRMHEVSYPPYADLAAFQDNWRELMDRLRNGSFSDLPPAFQDALNNVSDQRLEETNIKLDRLSRENTRLRERFHEEASERDVNVSVSIDDANRTQLNERMAAMQEAITSLESTVDTELVDEGANAEDSTISRTWEIAGDVNADATAVRIDYSNGTTAYLNASESDYVSVDSRAFQEDTISLNEYPLGSVSAAEVSVIAATSDGLGKASDTAKNPALSGDVPQLRALAASTLVPETGEQVSLTAKPQDGTGFKSVEDAAVYGPDGTTVNATLSGDTLEFTPTQPGPYRVKLAFSNLDGDQFTEVVRLKAVENGQDRPASVRAVSGPTGTYALVGDNLQSGEVDVKDGGAVVDVTAVATDPNETSEVHVYTEGMSLSPDHTTNLKVVEGDGEASIDRNVRAVMHAPAFPEDAYVYRVSNGDKEPLPEGKSASGIRRSGTENTTIQTYTNAKGEVSIRTISNPGILDKVDWFVQTRLPDVSIPGMAFTPDQSPAVRAGV